MHDSLPAERWSLLCGPCNRSNKNSISIVYCIACLHSIAHKSVFAYPISLSCLVHVRLLDIYRGSVFSDVYFGNPIAVLLFGSFDLLLQIYSQSCFNFYVANVGWKFLLG